VAKVIAFACDDSGVAWYRIRSPAAGVNRSGRGEVLSINEKFLPPAVVSTDSTQPRVRNERKRAIEAYDKLVPWAEVLWTNRYVDMMTGSLFKTISWGAGKPWIMDLDDDVFSVRASNPVHDRYRRKREDELMDVKEIESVEQASKKNMVWRSRDGQLFEVALKDEDTRQVCRRGIEHADALTVSTKPLARLYDKIRRKKHGKNTHIYICPNSLDPDLWDAPSTPPEHEEIRVGWAGGSSHSEDLDMIVPVIEWMLEKYPQTKFVWVNLPHKPLLDLAVKYPGRCVIHSGWSPADQWHDYYTALNFDIALVPLKRAKFNSGKSNLKWMEAAIKGQAVICSDTTPYKCVKSYEDGILCGDIHEWKASLAHLIENPRLRAEIGEAARARVLADFNMKKNAKIWAQVFDIVRDELGDMAQERTRRMRDAEVRGCPAPHSESSARREGCLAGA